MKGKVAMLLLMETEQVAEVCWGVNRREGPFPKPRNRGDVVAARLDRALPNVDNFGQRHMVEHATSLLQVRVREVATRVLPGYQAFSDMRWEALAPDQRLTASEPDSSGTLARGIVGPHASWSGRDNLG
ncbi:hypothetical protein [Marinobacter shengliensis]